MALLFTETTVAFLPPMVTLTIDESFPKLLPWMQTCWPTLPDVGVKLFTVTGVDGS